MCADTENLVVGDKFSITTPQGKKVPLVVRGIYKPPSEQLDPLLGEVTLAQRAFDQHFPRPKDLFSFVDTDEGVTSQTTAALEKTLGPFPDAVLHTKADWVDERAGGIDTILNIFYVLLALSVGGQPVRARERPRAGGLRAHARDRDAARDRPDQAADAPDDPS